MIAGRQAEFVETRIVSMEKRKPEPAPIEAVHDELGPVAVQSATGPSAGNPPNAPPAQGSAQPQQIPAKLETEPAPAMPPHPA